MDPSGCRPPRSKSEAGPVAREILAVFLAYLAFTIYALWPLPSVLGTHLSYPDSPYTLVEADVSLIVWALTWGSHALITAPWDLFDANIFYPAERSLAFSEHFLGHLPLFAPTWWVTGNPVFATNILILLMFPLSALGMYLLARRSVIPPAAFLAGLVYAFHPSAVANLGHFHLLGVQYLPLALFFADRWLEAGRYRDAVLLAGSLLLQLLTSYYLAYATAVAFGLYLPFRLFRWRGSLDRRRWVGLAAAIGFAGGAFVVASLPYLALRAQGVIPSGPTNLGWLLMPEITAPTVWKVLCENGIGLIAYGLVAAALLSLRRRNDWVWVGVALAFAGLVLSFGPTIQLGPVSILSPYRLLAEWVPGFATLRSPHRFLIVTQIGLALLVGLGFARLVSRLRLRLAWTAAAGTAVLVLLGFSTQPGVPPVHEVAIGEKVPAVYRWLATHGDGGPLLEIPRNRFEVAGRRMLWSTYHWLPIAGGYSAYTPLMSEYIYRIAWRLPRADALERLADTIDIEWIIVHREELQPTARWDGPLPQGLEKVGEFGSDLLLRVTRPRRPDAAERMRNDEETLSGVPLQALGDTCRGSVRLTESLPASLPPSDSVKFDLEIQNDEATAWPGLAFYPRHLVQLTGCIAPAGNSRCSSAPRPLFADIPGGGRLEKRLNLATPRSPGTYQLNIYLTQDSGGTLERCGFQGVHELVRVGRAAEANASP